MNLNGRLKRLESAVRLRESQAESQVRATTTAICMYPRGEDALAAFEKLGQEGYFDDEPDFPIALAEFRSALRSDDATRPPADYQPWESKRRRTEAWLDTKTRKQLEWLFEIRDRVRKGLPPLTAAEWNSLETWIENNADLVPIGERLQPWPREMPWIVVSASYLRIFFRGGWRQRSAGVMAEQVRQLRARFSDAKLVRDCCRSSGK